MHIYAFLSKNRDDNIMIRSMTGFGRYEEKFDGRGISVELKSVNHRYFEFYCHTTKGYSFLEDKLKSLLQSRISRGKVDMFVSIEADDSKNAEIGINYSLAGGYVNALRELAKTYNLPDDITVSVLTRYNDIFSVHKTPEDEEKLWEMVKLVANKAIDNFILMRETEGKRMEEDIRTRSNTILSIVEKIEERSPKTVEEYKLKLKERIKELIGEYKLDEQRLITEVAIFADKVAVAEETVRLRSHFKQLDNFLKSEMPIGRKVDFIIQEMNREANTIGSKVADAELAHMVVDIKAEIEKIREQIQNIE